MKLKTLQIMLLLTAVLCAIGIFVGLGDGSRIDEHNFRPPTWLKGLGGFAGGPRLSAQDLTVNGVALQEPLALPGNSTRQFNVTSADDEVRRVAFLVTGSSHGTLNIRYKPNPGQRLNGDKVKAQSWPNEEKGDPSFVVYDGGGIFVFTNAGPGNLKIRLED